MKGKEPETKEPEAPKTGGEDPPETRGSQLPGPSGAARLTTLRMEL